MRIYIKSDGIKTKITTEDGVELQKGITEIEYAHFAEDIPRAKLTMNSVSIDSPAEAEFYVSDPKTGDIKKVRHIEFADGGIWDERL